MSLLFSRPPFAILFVISKRIVDAFNAAVGRGFAHVYQEILEFHPPFTKVDSTATILRICPIGWLKTSLSYLCPDVICAATFSTSIVAVPYIDRSVVFDFQTSARPCSAISKAFSTNARGLSALAQTFPTDIRSVIFRKLTQHCQATKLLTCQVDHFWHEVMMYSLDWHVNLLERK